MLLCIWRRGEQVFAGRKSMIHHRSNYISSPEVKMGTKNMLYNFKYEHTSVAAVQKITSEIKCPLDSPIIGPAKSLRYLQTYAMEIHNCYLFLRVIKGKFLV
jgi:hypothetical protein